MTTCTHALTPQHCRCGRPFTECSNNPIVQS